MKYPCLFNLTKVVTFKVTMSKHIAHLNKNE
jgi:hypothetical protein